MSENIAHESKHPWRFPTYVKINLFFILFFITLRMVLKYVKISRSIPILLALFTRQRLNANRTLYWSKAYWMPNDLNLAFKKGTLDDMNEICARLQYSYSQKCSVYLVIERFSYWSKQVSWPENSALFLVCALCKSCSSFCFQSFFLNFIV